MELISKTCIGMKLLDKMALCIGPSISTKILVTTKWRTTSSHVSLILKEKTSKGFFDIKILLVCLISVYNGVPYAQEYTLEYYTKY